MRMIKDEYRYTDMQRRVRVVVVVRHGFDTAFARRNNQAPYFSVTADIYENGRDVGSNRNLIRDLSPELRSRLRWHMTEWPGLPMFYEANAVYWAELATGRSKWSLREGQDPIAAFKSTVVWGAVPHMDVYKPWELDLDLLRFWLQERLPHLRAAFQADMKEYT